jgi:hypothetical protein
MRPGASGNAIGILRVVVFACQHRYVMLRLFYVRLTIFPLRKEYPMPPRSGKALMNFKTMAQTDVPQGRNGKHKEVVTRILSDLDQLPAGIALKIPLADLEESKEKVRSALNRATHKGARNVATASDADFLYVWNAGE